MLSLLARFLFLMTVFVFLARIVRTLLGRAHHTAPRASGPRAERSGAMVRDPVCGMYLDSTLALRSERRVGVFYFCSEECRKKFLAAPTA